MMTSFPSFGENAKSQKGDRQEEIAYRRPWPLGAASAAVFVAAATAAAAAAGDPCATATVMTLPPREEDEPCSNCPACPALYSKSVDLKKHTVHGSA